MQFFRLVESAFETILERAAGKAQMWLESNRPHGWEGVRRAVNTRAIFMPEGREQEELVRSVLMCVSKMAQSCQSTQQRATLKHLIIDSPILQHMLTIMRVSSDAMDPLRYGHHPSPIPGSLVI